MGPNTKISSSKLYSGKISIRLDKYYLGNKIIEKGETPKVAALREMNEEIGYTGSLTPLFQGYLAPGYDTEKMYFFLASDLKISKKRLPQDEDEEIRIRRMSLSSALKRCISGKIIDCKTIAAVMMILNRKNELVMRRQ